MTTYADFTYYTNTYAGSRVREVDFPGLALRASAWVDRLTFNRAAAVITANTDAAAVEGIKNAVCAVAEALMTVAEDGDGVQSESVGNMSRSYSSASLRAQPTVLQLREAARPYLSGTGLMFPGLLSGE